eukprot:TRINITY_DN1507_c0_g1_i2.p1 TRINITY_DN1507_c0_g1~~TRINITY_DN1507_c0_g1_i2.p1  ORF type:complete len:276 (+),score=27.19 TRINITY_DN1507_c0_g1_i2:191-1018(+)
MRIFRRWGLPDLLPVLETPLQLYLVAVEKHYPDSNPYHNKLHACEMTQALHWFLQQCDQVLQLSPLEKFSTLFAGVVHDLGHPGLNNHFLCATRSKLSLTYNDISVLENWHASQAFELLLSRPEFNFTANFPEDMYQEFRALVVQLVLATDMAKHVEILGMWRSSTVAHVDLSDATSRLLALKLLTKCADLANVARPWLLCHEWADRVVAEVIDHSHRIRSHLTTPRSSACRATRRLLLAYPYRPSWGGTPTILPRCRLHSPSLWPIRCTRVYTR